MEQDLLIGELGALVGFDPKTIRYYEEVGLMPRPQRKHSGYASPGYRIYSAEDVERLRLIKGARLLGLSLAETGDLLASLNGRLARPRLRELLREKLTALDSKMKDLQFLRDRIARIRDVMAKEKADSQGSCCEPLCGPEICPPPLVQIERSGHEGANRTNPSNRR